jgi:hypothetical protein
MDELICVRTKGEYFRAGYRTNAYRDLPDAALIIRPDGKGPAMKEAAN